jgi:ribosomal-protein-alanine N-acetyltransferase
MYPAGPVELRVRLMTERLELRPLPAAAANVLPKGRKEAGRILGAALSADWPEAELLDVLPIQASASLSNERFGIWVMIERESWSVVGDIGFIGPPSDGGCIEIGYSVIPDRRRRGYATEAARAIVDWTLQEPEVKVVIASCDDDNEPSIRTLERIGFHRAGEADGQIRWRYGAQPE